MENTPWNHQQRRTGSESDMGISTTNYWTGGAWVLSFLELHQCQMPTQWEDTRNEKRASNSTNDNENNEIPYYCMREREGMNTLREIESSYENSGEQRLVR